MKTDNPEILMMRFANETGQEIFELLLTRSENLEVETFLDRLNLLTAATAVCLSSVLAPAVQAAPDRAAAADKLIAVCTMQVRRFLDPVILGETEL